MARKKQSDENTHTNMGVSVPKELHARAKAFKHIKWSVLLLEFVERKVSQLESEASKESK